MGSVALLALLFFSPQMMRADTAAQIKDQINAYTGGGTGSLRALLLSANNVAVSGTLTGVTTGLPINIDAGVTVSWTATISTSSTASFSTLISLSGSGTFEVTGGAITATGTTAINASTSDVTITVSGGTVSSTSKNGAAIYTAGTNSKVTVNSGTVSTTVGSAVWDDGANSLVTVSGSGQVQATGDGGTAIFSGGNVQVSGGIVNATKGYAIRSYSSSIAVTVSGGLVFAYGNTIIAFVIYLPNHTSGFTSATGTGVVIGWNQAAGHTTYTKGSSDDISRSPASATATWDVQGGSSGIAYANGTNTGFIPVSGVTVNAAAPPSAPSALPPTPRSTMPWRLYRIIQLPPLCSCRTLPTTTDAPLPIRILFLT